MANRSQSFVGLFLLVLSLQRFHTGTLSPISIYSAKIAQ